MRLPRLGTTMKIRRKLSILFSQMHKANPSARLLGILTSILNHPYFLRLYLDHKLTKPSCSAFKHTSQLLYCNFTAWTRNSIAKLMRCRGWTNWHYFSVFCRLGYTAFMAGWAMEHVWSYFCPTQKVCSLDMAQVMFSLPPLLISMYLYRIVDIIVGELMLSFLSFFIQETDCRECASVLICILSVEYIYSTPRCTEHSCRTVSGVKKNMMHELYSSSQSSLRNFLSFLWFTAILPVEEGKIMWLGGWSQSLKQL